MRVYDMRITVRAHSANSIDSNALARAVEAAFTDTRGLTVDNLRVTQRPLDPPPLAP